MSSDTFVAFVLDQLRLVGTIDCQRMFGGYGLSYRGSFFGIIFRGQLFFKTSPETRPAYEQRGMQPFRPNARQTLNSYFEVPADVIEDDEQLARWAEQAIQSAAQQ